jgi:hypothetical protein
MHRLVGEAHGQQEEIGQSMLPLIDQLESSSRYRRRHGPRQQHSGPQPGAKRQGLVQNQGEGQSQRGFQRHRDQYEEKGEARGLAKGRIPGQRGKIFQAGKTTFQKGHVLVQTAPQRVENRIEQENRAQDGQRQDKGPCRTPG